MLSIEADMVAQGHLVMLGTLRLEGRFDGTIVCTRLEIGIDGFMFGRVFAHELKVSGQLVGEAQARFVHLVDGAILEGQVAHEQLQMDESAALVG